jgi:hypothetical protein
MTAKYRVLVCETELIAEAVKVWTFTCKMTVSILGQVSG